MNLTILQFIGIFLLIVSIFGGLIGTFYGIYSGFAGLDAAESAGIGAVGGYGIQNSLISAAVGLTGSIIGILLLVIGTIKRSKTTNNQ